MTDKQKNPPAFPHIPGASIEGDMTIRDYFAAAALRESYAMELTEGLPSHDPVRRAEILARYSYELADAMLKQRDNYK